MPWVILAASLLLALVLGLVTWLLWKLMTRLLAERAETQQTLSLMVTSQTELTKNLLDRMMSKDLQTYAAMTTLNGSLTSSNDEYINRSDAAEAERLASYAGSTSVGDTLYSEDDAAQGFMTEIGLDDLTKLAEKLDD